MRRSLATLSSRERLLAAASAPTRAGRSPLLRGAEVVERPGPAGSPARAGTIDRRATEQGGHKT
ncbi:MAG: hypothetical protein ACK6BC_13580, partial [Cyanobacteriota bacterium]